MALDPNRWTLKTQEALQEASRLAEAAHNAEVLPATSSPPCSARTAASPCRSSIAWASPPSRCATASRRSLPRSPTPTAAARRRSRRALIDAFERAVTAQKEMGDEYLSVEHVLLALAPELGVEREQLLAALREVRGSHRVTSQNPEETYQALEKYGRDLTELARAASSTR